MSRDYQSPHIRENNSLKFHHFLSDFNTENQNLANHVTNQLRNEIKDKKMDRKYGLEQIKRKNEQFCPTSSL